MATYNLKWDNYRRSMTLIKKAKRNDAVNKMFDKYKDIIYGVFKDNELITETYMRLTNEYVETQDFMTQFVDMYRKLKRIKMIDYQKASSTWLPLLKNMIDNGMDSETEEQ